MEWQRDTQKIFRQHLVAQIDKLLAIGQSVPIAFDITAGIGCAILVMTIALVSGVMAVRTISHLEPANLLR